MATMNDDSNLSTDLELQGDPSLSVIEDIKRKADEPLRTLRRSKRTKSADDNGSRAGVTSSIVDSSKASPTTRARKTQKSQSETGGTSARSRNSISWTPSFLLTNPKSKLAKCNLSELVNRQLWELLSPEEQAECMSHLPSVDLLRVNDQSEESLDSNSTDLVDGFFERNSRLQNDLRAFQDDLREGRFQKSYLERAATAREKRARGDFDRWKDDQFELWWGQKQKLATGMLAGDTTRLKITDMAKSGMLRENDIWRYSRIFKGATIKKELKCTVIDKMSFSLTFLCPPKSEEYIRSGLTPLTIDGIENPSTLETRLLDEDGRISRGNRPNGNAFKCIRIIRGSEDIGSLFDVRMSAFEKLHSTV